MNKNTIRHVVYDTLEKRIVGYSNVANITGSSAFVRLLNNGKTHGNNLRFVVVSFIRYTGGYNVGNTATVNGAFAGSR